MNRQRREDWKGEDAKSGRTKLKKDDNNRMIEVIQGMKKEKPNVHSYIYSSVLTKAVIPQEDSFVTGGINSCNIIKSVFSCRTRETFHDNNKLNEWSMYDEKYESLNFTLSSPDKLHTKYRKLRFTRKYRSLKQTCHSYSLQAPVDIKDCNGFSLSVLDTVIPGVL